MDESVESTETGNLNAYFDIGWVLYCLNLYTMKHLYLCFLLCLSCSTLFAAQPASFLKPIDNGITKISIARGSFMLYAIETERKAMTAHDFEVLTFASQARGAQGLNAVPFFDAKDSEAQYLTAGGGADCRLEDYRLATNPAGDIVLVYAIREFGDSYADEQWVSFHLYKLTQGGDEDGPGPDWYFQEYKSVKSHKKYCDVNDAMEAEVKPSMLQILELKKTK